MQKSVQLHARGCQNPAPITRAQLMDRRAWDYTVMALNSAGSRQNQLNRTLHWITVLGEPAPPQQQIQQQAEVDNIKVEPQGAEDNAVAKYNMNAEDDIDEEDPEISDTETEYKTEFKESPTAAAMIVDPIFGHERRRNAVDDDPERPSIRWDAWLYKSRKERAKGRKPVGYKHGDRVYSYDDWVDAKRQRQRDMQYLFDYTKQSG